MRPIALTTALGIAISVTASGFAAQAQGRPSTTVLSCGQANALVSSSRAIVLATGGGTYDRYVRDQLYCPHGQETKAAFAPTRDNPQCFVGYLCVEPEHEFDR